MNMRMFFPLHLSYIFLFFSFLYFSFSYLTRICVSCCCCVCALLFHFLCVALRFSFSYLASPALSLLRSLALSLTATLRHVCQVSCRARRPHPEVGQHLILCKYSLSSLGVRRFYISASLGEIKFQQQNAKELAQTVCVCASVNPNVNPFS